MVLDNTIFDEMTDEEMQTWVENNTDKISDLIETGWPLLYIAVFYGKSPGLISWLIETMNCDVNSRGMGDFGGTPLHVARSEEIVCLLLEKGADPTLRDAMNTTPLMSLAQYGFEEVTYLLGDDRVVAEINSRGTNYDVYGRRREGYTALHFACDEGVGILHDLQLFKVLIAFGGDPFLLNADGQTPLELLQAQGNDENKAAIAFLELAMAEIPRTFSLAKARMMTDANHAITKDKEEADKKRRTRSEKKGLVLAKTPVYLKDRVEEGKPLPQVEMKHPCPGNKEEEKQVAVLQYVLRDASLYAESEGMSEDVFVELLEMVVRKWDPIRKGEGDFFEMEGEGEEAQNEAQNEEQNGEPDPEYLAFVNTTIGY